MGDDVWVGAFIGEGVFLKAFIGSEESAQKFVSSTLLKLIGETPGGEAGADMLRFLERYSRMTPDEMKTIPTWVVRRIPARWKADIVEWVADEAGVLPIPR